MTAARTLTPLAPPPAYDRPYRAERPAFLWLLEREIVRFLKIWRFSIAGQVISALMFVLVFGVALATQIKSVDGIPYDRFILPGLVVQAVIMVGFINGTTSLFEARHDRYLHNVLASPLRWWEINLALVLGAVVREILTAGCILAVGMPLTGMGVARPGVAFVATVMLLVTASQIGVLAGAYSASLDHIYSIETLVVLPLGFLSGIFYSVSQLPPAWALVSRFNPAVYFVQAYRIGFLGQADLSTGVVLAVTTGCAILLTGWSLLVFRSGARLKP